MFFLENLLFCHLFLKLNFILLLTSLSFMTLLVFTSKFNSLQLFFRNYSIFIKLRIFTILSLIISFLLLVLSFIFYLNYIYTTYGAVLIGNQNIIPKINFNYSLKIDVINLSFNAFLSLDFFGFIILFLAYSVGFLTILSLDTRLYWNNIKYLYFFNLFVLIVFLFVSITNILLLFLFYELLMLPSFFFVFFVSPGRRSIQASFYFLMWTQIGSFIVLVAISYIIAISGCYEFYSIKNFNFSNNEIFWIYASLFLGFGIKVPIWPFHYWITKTHVEAPSGFSIYLSGFLVKSALFGFYKITNTINYFSNSSVFVSICLIGIIDASIKMWGQLDLKKLVAYCTIQEMNMIYLLFCFGDLFLKEVGFLFSLTHAFLSALMFYIVDCIYRRFHSRSILQINSLLSFVPNLTVSIFFMSIFFAGLPGTLKFSVEFCIFTNIFDISIFSLIILVVSANCLGLIGFSKSWFNVIFGIKTNLFHYIQVDLSKKEFLIINFCFFILFFFSFLPNFLL